MIDNDNHNQNHSYLPNYNKGGVGSGCDGYALLLFCFVLFVVTMHDRDRASRLKSRRGFLGGNYS